MEKKYELTKESKVVKTPEGKEIIVFRIKALQEISIIQPDGTKVVGVEVGSLGGWVQSEVNLSQTGLCWVDNDVIVCQNARVEEDAHVTGNCELYGNALVKDVALVEGAVKMYDDTRITGKSWVTDCIILRDATSIESSILGGSITCDGCTRVEDSLLAGGIYVHNSMIRGGSSIIGPLIIGDNSELNGVYNIQRDEGFKKIKSRRATEYFLPEAVSNKPE